MSNGWMSTYFAKSESQSRVSEMDYKDLRQLVKQGEGPRLEFKLKANHPEKIVREMVAFANTQGGTLLVGVSDDRQIVGSKFADEDEYALVRALEKYCSPPIPYQLERIQVAEEREVLVFKVAESPEKPHFIHPPNEDSPIAYVRVHDRSIQASKEVRQILRKSQQHTLGVQIVYGQREQQLMHLLENQPQITVNELAQKARLPRWLAARTLVTLVLANVLRILPQEGDGDLFELVEPN
jgi:predicted HTH transcriptional regulator